MDYEKTFHCFHGTTMDSYEVIKETEEFIFEIRDNHWLGNGIYFFLDDQLKASWWARMAVQKKQKKNSTNNPEPCVLYIVAKVGIDEVIDLNVESGQNLLNDFISFLKENKIEISIPTDKQLTSEEQQHYFRCKVMDLLVETEGYKASCYLFPNESKPYIFKSLSNYGIMNNKGNQICVYDQSILDFSKMHIV